MNWASKMAAIDVTEHIFIAFLWKFSHKAQIAKTTSTNFAPTKQKIIYSFVLAKEQTLELRLFSIIHNINFSLNMI
jgi:hypothetical protein